MLQLHSRATLGIAQSIYNCIRYSSHSQIHRGGVLSPAIPETLSAPSVSVSDAVHNGCCCSRCCREISFKRGSGQLNTNQLCQLAPNKVMNGNCRQPEAMPSGPGVTGCPSDFGLRQTVADYELPSSIDPFPCPSIPSSSRASRPSAPFVPFSHRRFFFVQPYFNYLLFRTPTVLFRRRNRLA